MMVGCYVEACRRRDLKVNADKTKVMLLSRLNIARKGMIKDSRLYGPRKRKTSTKT